MESLVVQAPATLGRETYEEFQREALESLESLRPSEPDLPLVIDLTSTGQVDSSGLGALVQVQRRSAELRRSVHLRGASEELRFLLVMTRLDDRFVFEGPAVA